MDPMLEVRAFFDIGVADATSIWLAVLRHFVIHYIEGSVQPALITWLLAGPLHLPHDGVNKNVVTGKRGGP